MKQYDHTMVPRERAERAIRLQADLAAAGFPVPAPRPTLNGALWAETAEGMVVVMPFLPGRRRTRGSLSTTEAANLGALIGRLHAQLRHRPVTVSARAPVTAPWEALRDQALAHESDFDRLVIETADYVTAARHRAPPVDWQALPPWQLCHGDLHLDNLLFDDHGQITGLLDFDNAAPGWPSIELMMAWNLCLCPDPGAPAPSPEGDAFFAAYQQANGTHLDLPAALGAYWHSLVNNTWPAAIRYREGIVKEGWTELLSIRLGAAREIEKMLSK